MGNFLDEEPVRLVGRLGRNERLQHDGLFLRRANRFGFEFDAVNGEAPLDAVLPAISGEGSGAPLAALKVLTTLGKFRKVCRRERIEEGDWFVLELEPRGKRRGPLAWAHRWASVAMRPIVRWSCAASLGSSRPAKAYVEKLPPPVGPVPDEDAA